MTQLTQVVKDEVFEQSNVVQIICGGRGRGCGRRSPSHSSLSLSVAIAGLFLMLYEPFFLVLLPLIDGVFYLIFYCAVFYCFLSLSILFVTFSVAAPKLCVKFTKRCGVCLQFAYLN